MRPGRLATSLAARCASVVLYIARGSEHEPVDHNIHDAKIVWQAKANPKQRRGFRSSLRGVQDRAGREQRR